MGMGIVSDIEFEIQRNNLIPKQIQSDSPTSHPYSNTNNPESHPENRPNTPRDIPIVKEGVVVELVGPGRKDGDVKVPETLRALISSTSISDGRQAALSLAKQFGLSESSVSAYVKGANSTASYNSPDEILSTKNNKTRASVTKRARNRLMMAINQITEDKLTNAKLRDISGVARDMSQVIKNMEKDTDKNRPVNGPQFVVFAPTINEESKYKTIEVRE